MEEKLYENQGKTKLWKKVLSVILAIIIGFGTIVSLIVGSSYLQDRLGINAMLSAYAAEIVDTKGTIAVNESAMLADNNIIDLKNRDGSNTVYVFSEPISFTDENGKLKTKDISVEKQNEKELMTEGYEYSNGQNDYRINFSTDSSKGLYITFGNSGYYIIPKSDFNVSGKESTSDILHEEFEDFEYKNIYGIGTNLKFYPQLNGVKDEIVLNQNIDKNTFSFELKTENCTAVLNDDGTVSLVSNDENEFVQTFSAPFAYDSEYIEGEKSEHYTDCSYTLEQAEDDTYILTVNVDKSWLESSSTIYPVTIDPTTSNLDNYRDAGIYNNSSSKNVCYGKEQTCCFGRASEYGYGRVLNQFTMPEGIKKGAKINSAYTWQRETTGRTTSTKVTPHFVTSAWTEGDVTWETRPSYSSVVGTTKTINSKSTDDPDNAYWYKFSIANMVKKWADGEKNYGFCFVSSEETDKNYNWRAFTSKQYSSSAMRPYTVINYTNDTTAPTISSVTGNATAWTNSNVTLTINGAADNSGGAGLHSTPYSFSTTKGSYSWQSGKTKTFSTNCTVYVYVRDALGNIALCSTVTINKIDKTKPDTPSVSGNPSEWTNSSVTLTASAADKSATSSYGKSGIKDYSFSTKKGTYSWQTSNQKSYSSNATVYVYTRDNAGNISDPKEVVISKITKDESYLLLPEFYNDDKLLGIINPRNNDDIIQYKIGDDGEWNDYFAPFATPDGKEVKVYARFKDSSKETSINFTTNNAYDSLTSYTEQVVDLTIANNNAFFDIAREYNSVTNEWYFSTESNVKTTSTPNVYTAVMPDGSVLSFVRAGDCFENKTTAYSLSLTDAEYIIKADAIVYYYDLSTGRLKSVSDEYNHRIILNYIDNELVSITAEENNNIHKYDIVSSKGKIKSVTTPVGEVLNYEYDENDNLVYVGYDKNSLQFSRESNIILSEYEYSNNKLTVSNKSVISYDDGKLASVTKPNGESTSYSYSTSKFNSYGVTLAANDFDVFEIKASNGDVVCYNSSLLPAVTISGDEAVVYRYKGSKLEKEITYVKEDGVFVEDLSADDASSGDGTEDKTQYTYYANGNIKTSVSTEIEDNITTKTVITYLEDEKVQSSEVTTTKGGKTSVVKSAYTYDSFGNLATEQTVSTDEENQTSISSVSYTYDSLNRNILLEDKTDETIAAEYKYSPVGNVIYQRDNDSVTRTIYDDYSRVVQEIGSEDYKESEDSISDYTDSYADTQAGSTYVYADNGNLDSETNRIGVKTTYEYYKNSSIVNTETFDSYVFTYDKNGNTTNVTIGGETYADYSYNSDNNPTIVNYGNGQSVRYEYDSVGNLMMQYHNDDAEPYVKYTYNGVDETSSDPSQVAAINDEVGDAEVDINTNDDYVLTSKCNIDTNQKTVYKDNIAKVYSLSNEKELLYSYTIEPEDKVEQKPAAGTENTESAESTEADNTPQTKLLNYSFIGDSAIGISTTDSVDTISITNAGSLPSFTVNSTDKKAENGKASFASTIKNGDSHIISTDYTYDSDGNVSKELITLKDRTIEYNYTYDGTRLTGVYNDDLTVNYHYDKATNAVVRDDMNMENYHVTNLYEYDSQGRGNMTASAYMPYVEKDKEATIQYNRFGTSEYNITDQIWIDAVDSISENGREPTTFEYSNGNPVKMDDLYFTWTSGRMLESVYYYEDEEKIEGLHYTYSEDGIRTSKTSEGVTTYYTTIDGAITSQYQRDNAGKVINQMLFLYDSTGSLLGFTYDGETYFYITNHMGDVIGITDADGNYLVSYYYDAWGNLETYDVNDDFNDNGSLYDLANLNPMRYRGYYFDSEFGAYYLQSRYYLPTIYRFLNADLPEYAKLQKNESAGTNLFAYCNNDPVNNVDYSGNIAGEAIAVVSIAKIIAKLLAFIGISLTANYILNNLDQIINAFRDFCSSCSMKLKSAYNAIKSIIKTTYNYVKKYVKQIVETASATLTISIAHAKIKQKIKKERNSFSYWKATRANVSGFAYVVIGKGVKKATAITRMRSSLDVFCSSKRVAFNLAKSSYSNKKPVGPETSSGKGYYYYHYHVYKHIFNSHAFFI
ncbi:MAG: DNRLRE domain-containing protein [Clostridium sp.]|nr:DNRLRE domain-containing protein [Clostridium sp.]